MRSQPALEVFFLRILAYGSDEQRALHGKADAVGRLVALAGAAAAFGSLERGEERRAELTR